MQGLEGLGLPSPGSKPRKAPPQTQCRLASGLWTFCPEAEKLGTLGVLWGLRLGGSMVGFRV